MRGRGGYSAPFDSRGRPIDDGRRRNSPPPRQYADRGRGAPRGRGVRGRCGRNNVLSQDARQAEVVFFSFLDGGFAQIFGQIVSIIVETLRNTRLGPSRLFKMKKTSLPVDVLGQKPLCFKELCHEIHPN